MKNTLLDYIFQKILHDYENSIMEIVSKSPFGIHILKVFLNSDLLKPYFNHYSQYYRKNNHSYLKSSTLIRETSPRHPVAPLLTFSFDIFFLIKYYI